MRRFVRVVRPARGKAYAATFARYIQDAAEVTGVKPDYGYISWRKRVALSAKPQPQSPVDRFIGQPVGRTDAARTT